LTTLPYIPRVYAKVYMLTIYGSIMEDSQLQPVTASAQALRAAFKAIGALVERVMVVPADDGWRIYAISADKITLANVLVGTAAFSDYHMWGPFAVAVKDILEPLSKPGDSATLDISSGALKVAIGRLRFTRGLEVPWEEYPRMPHQNLTAEVSAPADAFGEVIGAVSEKEARYREIVFALAGDVLTVTTSEDGQPFGEVAMELPRADALIMEGSGRAAYSHRAVREIFSAVPRGADVDVQFADDNIMLVSYAVEGADIVFALAPWVEEASRWTGPRWSSGRRPPRTSSRRATSSRRRGRRGGGSSCGATSAATGSPPRCPTTADARGAGRG